MKYLLILVALIYLQTVKNTECPQLQTYHCKNNLLYILPFGTCQQLLQYLNNYVDPQYDKGFEVKNFLRIPKTNILIVNTIHIENFNESIVYYIDLASSSGETINVIKRKIDTKINSFILINNFIIKAEYVIICMDYLESLDKVLITNYGQIILADPYTLKLVSATSNSQTYHSIIIPNTGFALITLKHSKLQIFDPSKGNIVQIAELTKYIGNAQQYFSQVYQFKCQTDLVILSSNQDGIISLNLDIKSKTIQYLGKVYLIIYQKIYFSNNLLGENIVKDYYRRFTKHPNEDIIFMGGDNLEIIVIKVISFADNKYEKLNHLINI